jgi:KDO2-lipid IV(A) lauroyltransferase
MADLMMETIKMITVSEASLRKRMKPTNPELVNHYFDQGRSIIAAAGHYCNWEMAALAFGLLTDEKRIIVYKPQTNEVFNDMFNRVRARFGAILVAMKQTLRTMISLKNDLTFSVLVSDQTPNFHEINYFTDFLNQPTAVFLGIEKLAKMIDAAVMFYRIDSVKRGYYTIHFSTPDRPAKTNRGTRDNRGACALPRKNDTGKPAILALEPPQVEV